MNKLLQKDIDYRLIYMIERKFEERIIDVYTAKQTTHRAPEFIDILKELLDIEAALFIEFHEDELLKKYSREQIQQFKESVEKEDPDTLNIIIGHMEENFIQLFTRDVFLYLQHSQLFFFENDWYSMAHTYTHNSPLNSVW